MKDKDLDEMARNNLRYIEEMLAADKIQVRINRNRQTLISLRYQKDGSLRLSMHHQLLDYPGAIKEVIRFAQKGGHGKYPKLDEAMYAVYYAQLPQDQKYSVVTADQEVFDLEPIGDGFNFRGCFDEIFETYFRDLKKPHVDWARSSGQRDLRSIRFGAYFTDRQEVLLNPRLKQSWVARIFVEHIIHHELCHHKQAMYPIKGEPAHSKRFKEWEAEYPHFDLARRWEKAHLRKLLANPEDIEDGFQESFLD